MDRPAERGEWRYVWMEPGALSVMMGGVTMMHVWSADSLALPQSVRLNLFMNYMYRIIIIIDEMFIVIGAKARTYAFYGQGSGPIMLTSVGCIGEEPSLLNCTHYGYGVTSCGHYEDAGVHCPGKCDIHSACVIYGADESIYSSMVQL